MQPSLLLVLYCAILVCGSLLGGWLPTVLRLSHAAMQLTVSFVAGLMLGVGLFHLLPHAAQQSGSMDDAARWAVAGLLTTFFLIRVFHFHQHTSGESDALQLGTPLSDHTRHATAGRHDHSPHCAPADHEHQAGHAPHGLAGPESLGQASPGRRSQWVGVALGLSLHTAIDGVALSADVAAHATGRGTLWGLAGLSTFLAVLLHKPLDAFSITTLMAAGGWPKRPQFLVNAFFALMCPAGAAAFYLGFAGQSAVLGAALAFSAGVFLCISLGDLLPEVQFHAHDPVKLSIALLAGVSLAYGVHWLE